MAEQSLQHRKSIPVAGPYKSTHLEMPDIIMHNTKLDKGNYHVEKKKQIKKQQPSHTSLEQHLKAQNACSEIDGELMPYGQSHASFDRYPAMDGFIAYLIPTIPENCFSDSDSALTEVEMQILDENSLMTVYQCWHYLKKLSSKFEYDFSYVIENLKSNEQYFRGIPCFYKTLIDELVQDCIVL